MTEPVRNGIRLDFPESQKNEDPLTLLNSLNKFFTDVKDEARLRAKKDGKTVFLHTRTGTIFGQIWKKLTICFPEACEQRRLARQIGRAHV